MSFFKCTMTKKGEPFHDCFSSLNQHHFVMERKGSNNNSTSFRKLYIIHHFLVMNPPNCKIQDAIFTTWKDNFESNSEFNDL